MTFSHAENGDIQTKPVSMVTASLDYLSLHKILLPDRDLYISGALGSCYEVRGERE